MQKNSYRYCSWLWYLLGVALLLRLAALLVSVRCGGSFLTPDSGDYLLLADSIVNGGRFVHDGAPEIFRIPGYPLFLAIIKFAGGGVLTVIVLQTILGTFNCWLTWRLSMTTFRSSAVAALATLFQAGAVVAIVFNNKVLSETLFTTFLLIGLLFVSSPAYCGRGKTDKNCLLSSAAAGIFIALACLCRAILLPALPLFFAYIWWRSRRIKFAALFVLPVVLVIAGWSVRNYYVAGFAGYSSVGAINLYRYNACALLAAQHKRSFTLQQELCDRNLAKYDTQADRAKFAQSQGEKAILAAPATYMFIHLKSDMSNLLPAVGELFKMAGADIGGNGTLAVINSAGLFSGIKHYFKGKWWLIFIALPLVGWLLVSYVAVALALLLIITNKAHRCLLPPVIFYSLIIAWFLLVPGPASHPRFRVPVTPLLSMLAAWGSIATAKRLGFCSRGTVIKDR